MSSDGQTYNEHGPDLSGTKGDIRKDSGAGGGQTMSVVFDVRKRLGEKQFDGHGATPERGWPVPGEVPPLKQRKRG